MKFTTIGISARHTATGLFMTFLMVVLPVGQPTAQGRTYIHPWPTSGVVLREFAPPDPDWLPGHRGLDLAPGIDNAVRTPASGVVAWRGFTGSIPVVVVRHGVARATYQPVLSDLAVGTTVRPNQILGVLDSGGHCSDRCLHWGLKVNDRYLDPRLLLIPPRPVLVAPPES